MKLATPSDLHLTYCSNIHPGETWAAVKQNLHNYLPLLKTRLAPTAPFGVGLRLSDQASKDLQRSDHLARLVSWLEENGLYVFTLNGFPFGGFHHQVVKDQVYAPDWTQAPRLDYTLRLIEILAKLLPPDQEGSISTLPLSYKPWHPSRKQQEQTLHRSCQNLALAIAKLANIRERRGQTIHLDLEPEPDGLLENTQEVIDFFQDWLIPIVVPTLSTQQGVTAATAENWVRRHIQVCYDTCHFAVEYEEPESILMEFQQAGIKIGKIQLSSAIKISIPQNRQERQEILDKLQPFGESTYLHQVIAQDHQGNLHHYRDLAEAMPYLVSTTATQWRTHFHVPLFLAHYAPLTSTQDHLVKLLSLLHCQDVTKHLEIETYTWEILPPELKLDLLTSIEREYQWVLTTLSKPLANIPA